MMFLQIYLSSVESHVWISNDFHPQGLGQGFKKQGDQKTVLYRMGQQTIENNNTNKSNITVPSVLYTYIIYIYT